MGLKGKISALKFYTRKYSTQFFWFFLEFLPLFKKIKETRSTQTPVTFSMWFYQKVLGNNKKAYWPVHRTSLIQGVKNIKIGIETCPGYMPGCYVDGIEKIEIGDYTQIGPNVGLLSTNHDLYDNRISVSKGPIIIGKYCWLGMGARILPGVKLGDYTIVGANAVVTKSFEDGYCVLGGNPAKVIKELDRTKCVPHTSKNEYIGYIRKKDFEKFRKKHLSI